MLKPLVLAVSLALLTPHAALAQSQPAQAAKAATAPKPAPAWVEQSNAHAQILLQAQAPFVPEQMSFFGVPGYDTQVFDFRPGYAKRFREATQQARTQLAARAQAERDPNVQQDLAILIQAADDAIESSEVNERLTVPFLDVGQTVFQGIKGLLTDQVPAERRKNAVERLRRYAGLTPDTQPLATLARERYAEHAGDAKRLKPTKIEVEQSLANLPTYLTGLEELFAKYGLAAEAKPALDALKTQLEGYADFSRGTVLPNARTTYELPKELYALQLKNVGIDVDPLVLVDRARVGFMETRAAMQQLAPLVAKEKGLKESDYIAVMRALKRKTLPNEKLEAHYRNVVMPALEEQIREHDVVTLPQRPMQMRLGTAAESAAQPAPHFLPAPLIGNTGQQGTFVLPLGNPNAGAEGAYDDFNFPAVAWTLSAHEGRPGHELQFTAMVERGISLARTLYAFNSVNVEGWALYAEAEMVPYEPLEGQLFALQFRLLRAARAMLDPMLNLGLIDRDTAFKVLTEQVGLSNAMARQEVDRYTVRSPGQAGSYFYGYSKILALRAETELALGDAFDRQAFNDFLLDQGLLPPDLLAQAVRERFIPEQKAKAKGASKG
ncbi:DUF885 domain-containing protein [Cognatilysobacter bugurensis]|uniref:DUF885 domain-containing protein n=1 Tax=Cognatilysobacter bugurensis TaxID=543356 RepID=A0A918W8R2_9GAMM|nr:DUF885 domain-containing protein [Lysobacter bugurensis]GHA82056.1 hypothetical protein GCM10007067_19960 [Lysobacter bugurensis]